MATSMTRVHILNRLALGNTKALALTLPTNPPLRLKLDTRVPAPDRSHESTTVVFRFEGRWRLSIESGLTACRRDDIFPQVSTRGGGGDVCGDGRGAGRGVVLEPGVEEFEVVPDFAGLVVAAVGLAFEDGDVSL